MAWVGVAQSVTDERAGASGIRRDEPALVRCARDRRTAAAGGQRTGGATGRARRAEPAARGDRTGCRGRPVLRPGDRTGLFGSPVLLRLAPNTTDPHTARRLWEISAELTDVRYEFRWAVCPCEQTTRARASRPSFHGILPLRFGREGQVPARAAHRAPFGRCQERAGPWFDSGQTISCHGGVGRSFQNSGQKLDRLCGSVALRDGSARLLRCGRPGLSSFRAHDDELQIVRVRHFR
jgi:hypothetical protein